MVRRTPYLLYALQCQTDNIFPVVLWPGLCPGLFYARIPAGFDDSFLSPTGSAFGERARILFCFDDSFIAYGERAQGVARAGAGGCGLRVSPNRTNRLQCNLM